MKIKTKIVTGYAVISVCVLIVAVVSLFGLKQVRSDYQNIIDGSDFTVITLREIQYYITGQANDERGFLLTGNPEFKGEIQDKAKNVRQRIDRLKPLMISAKEKELLDKLSSAHTKFTDINMRVIDLYGQGKTAEAQQVSFGEGRKLRKDLEASYNEVVKIQEDEATNNRSRTDSYSERMNLLVLSAAVLLLIFGLLFGVLFSNRIIQPILKITRDMREGKLNFETLSVANDEVGVLTHEFGNMITRLRKMVLGVQATAEQVASSSEELTASAEQSAEASNQVAIAITEVAEGASEQLTAVHHTRETVDQINDGIQQVMTKINHMSDSSRQTAVAATDGRKTVDTAISQMDKIDRAVSSSAAAVIKLGERSNEIGQIVDTISGIAGQTNLLALNAAIEAARAGEQGRGFSVVAEEVRKLAEQSAESAKQIADLIGKIQTETSRAVAVMQEGTSEVKAGTDVVAAAGQSFAEISASVDHMSGQVNEILITMRNLAAGSQSIVTSVDSMEKVSKNTAGQTQMVSASTEEQSASMEEIASSSQKLAQMAEELKTTIRAFQV